MMGELSPGASVAIGVLVGLLSTTIQSIGLTLQRKSHLLEDEKEDEYARRPPYRRRRWQVGMSMFLIANIVGSTVQITTLPLPVLSTLQASGLVFNTICATLILKEPFTRFSILGTVLVAGGAVLIGIFGAMTEPSHNLHQLLDLLARRNFLLWLFGTFFFAAGFAVLAWFSHRILPRGHHRLRLMQGMMYGAVSGILSAHTLLVAKSAVELLVRTIVDRHNQFNQWESWIILLALLTLALSQLYFLHLGLKLCSTSVLYPFVFCVYNIIAIMDGLIYFRQTSRLPPLHAGLIALGTIVLLVGVVALSWRLEESNAYHAVAVDESGHTHRVRSMSRIATPTLPQTVLAPGMGIVEGTAAESEDDSDEAPAARTNPDDEESALIIGHKNNPDVHESTPLLHAKTMPNLARRSLRSPVPHKRDSAGSSSLRTPKLRRTTVATPGATDELWDELVENDGYRRRSMDFGTMTSSRAGPKRTHSGLGSKSPSSVRFRDRPTSSASGANARKGNGLLGTRHGRSASASSGSKLLNTQRWKFWDPSTPGSSQKQQAEEQEAGDTDGSEEIPPTVPSRPRSSSAAVPGSQEERSAEWLRLKWWKDRWKSKDDGQG